MDDKNREKIFRLRLNQAEFDALIKLTIATKAESPSALLRSFIHQSAPK